MIHHVVFVVGSPGAGKTTALRALALPAHYSLRDTEVRWTLTPPFALIGNYEGSLFADSSNQGGDSVARHANLLSLEYWRRNIYPDPAIKATLLDGEMYLWSRIFEAFGSHSLQFVTDQDLNYKPAGDEALFASEKYEKGGLYSRTYKQILEADPERFPIRVQEPVERSLRVSCVNLVIPPELALARRNSREASAAEDKAKLSDSQFRTVASKQRNFADRFKEAAATLFIQDDNPLGYLEIEVEGKNPVEVSKLISDFALS